MAFSSSDPSLIKWCCGESPRHDSPISESLFCVLMAGLRRAKYEVCCMKRAGWWGIALLLAEGTCVASCS